MYIYEEIASQIINLEKRINKLKVRLERISLHGKQRGIIRDILNNLECAKDNGLTKTVTIHSSEVEEAFRKKNSAEELKNQVHMLGKRYGKKTEVAKVPCSLELFKNLESELTIAHDEEIIRISLKGGDKYSDLLKILANELNNEVIEYNHHANTEKFTLAQLEEEDGQIVKQVKDISFHDVDLSITKPNLFPLRDNMVFGHAIQLSFDPNVSSFIIDAQKIEDSGYPLEKKRRQLIQAMQQILPIIKTYLRLIMTNTNQTAGTHSNVKAYQPIFP